MRKACFIIPYFGTLPNTFDIFLRTCSYNPDFDWLILTDDHRSFNYPANVHIQYTTFTQFVERVQSHFDFPIALYRPYKICDFRAAFGVIFEEELKEYSFWGHCDLDQFFGRIDSFITDEIFESYDKILCLGHFSLYRNNDHINHLYLTSDKSRMQNYRDAFSYLGHWIFDEWPSQDKTSFPRICKQENINTFYAHNSFCDLKPFSSLFQRYIFDHIVETWELEQIKNTIFLWQAGRPYCCHITPEKNVVRSEILYVHIRQRQLSRKSYNSSQNIYCIIPNRIISTESISDTTLKKHLRNTKLRSLLFPDEIMRTTSLIVGYGKALLRKVLRACFK